MRSDVEVRLGPGNRERLEAVLVDRNSAQKHVWRAKIILATADGLGTTEIMRRSGKSKPSVWRWQQRFMTDGVERASARQDAAVAYPALGADDHRSRDRADRDRAAAKRGHQELDPIH